MSDFLKCSFSTESAYIQALPYYNYLSVLLRLLQNYLWKIGQYGKKIAKNGYFRACHGQKRDHWILSQFASKAVFCWKVEIRIFSRIECPCSKPWLF